MSNRLIKPPISRTVSTEPDCVVSWLSDPAAYNHPVSDIELVETHISRVFLTGQFAYKTKKPVKLPFVDFSTLELRRQSCEDEVRLNRRLTDTLYIGVVAIGGTRHAPKVGGSPPLEYAVKMRQFPAQCRLDHQIELRAITREHIHAFAQEMNRFHRDRCSARIGSTKTEDSIHSKLFLDNLAELSSTIGPNYVNDLTRIRDWLDQCCRILEPTLVKRVASGFVRECHGDLHLENLVLLDQAIVAFDALDFSKRLRTIDVIDEIIFLSMDLAVHGRSDLGYAFLNRYLEICGDYAGLRLARIYMVHRALVRAKVCSIRNKPNGVNSPSAQTYLEFATRLITHRKPLLIITRGLSGSGKTRLGQELVTSLPAICVRSDLERKRLAGLKASASSNSGVGTGIYETDMTNDTYEALRQAAIAALQANLDIVIDASFLKKSRRAVFRDLAMHCACDFLIIDCRAPTEMLRQRIAQRAICSTDASEATPDVLDYQIANEQPLTEAELACTVSINTSEPLDIDAIKRRIKRRRDKNPRQH